MVFGLRGGFERGIVEPRNLGTRAGPPWFRYVAGGEFRVSSDLGGAATIGFAIAPNFHWRTSALFTFGHGIDLAVGCQTRVNFGGRAQVQLDDGLRTGFFIIRVERGPGYARDCNSSTPLAN